MKLLFRAGVIALAVFIFHSASAQKSQYKVLITAFYNLENFYDTINDPGKDDEEFLPTGIRSYNTAVYYDKIGRLATVLSQMGTDKSPDGAAIIGVAEIENDTVLTDLCKHSLLKKRNYKSVHYNSPDARGVDVGLLYNPKYFRPLQSAPLFVKLPGGAKDAYFTRDILWVKGMLDGEMVHLYVNHWPSRRGGEERSSPAREAAAKVARAHIDSIARKEGIQKVILMGDLNDDPINLSLTRVMQAKAKKEEVREADFYNPWVDFYKKGIGTLAFQDAWGLFDQIIVSQPWLEQQQKGYFLYQAHIFNREYMVENTGKYRGYPMRTWDGNSYRSGYSDHFPTYLIMLKKIW